MPNLSNKENVVLADLISDHRKFNAADIEASRTLSSVNLPVETHTRFPLHISGGERQRVAFARGIQPAFSVIFGDEPTGNLDEENSTQLMEIVRREIEREKKKTAIIVSHNIDLSLSHADRIIILTNSTKGNHYNILPDKIIVRKDKVWYEPKMDEKDKTLKYEKIDNPKQYIKDILHSNISAKDKEKDKKRVKEENDLSKDEGKIEKIDMLLCKLAMLINAFKTKVLRRNSKINPDFLKLFFSREYDELTGKRNFGFWLFMFAVAFTLSIIGWTNSSVIDLEKSMNDPFVNSLDVIHNNENMIEPVRNLLDGLMSDQDTVKKYQLHRISYFNGVDLSFINLEKTDSMGFRGRTIDHDDPILGKILDKKINNAMGRSFYSSEDEGIIVTRNLLNTINAKENSPFLILRKEKDGAVYKVPVTIIAVVDHLPGTSTSNDFLVTTKFFDSYNNIEGNYPCDMSEKLRILSYLNEEEISIFNEKINILLRSIVGNRFTSFDCNYTRVQGSDSIAATLFYKNPKNNLGLGEDNSKLDNRSLYSFEIIPTPGLTSIGEADSLYRALMGMAEMKELFKNNPLFKEFVQQSYYSNLSSAEGYNVRSGISFLFDDTEMIYEFAEMFKQATQPLDPNQIGLILDMSKVNSMYTFFTVSNLTSIISIILIILSVFAILLYIYQQLNMHLYKIRRNIGTLMACGLNTRPAYKLLVFTYVVVCYFVPLVVVLIVQLIFPSFLTLTGSTKALIFSGLTTVLVFAGLWVVFRIADKKYFYKTPSDLIYSRTN